jgi:hypothetical protein
MTATPRHARSDSDMRHDNDNRAQRIAAWALFVCAAIVAVVTFVLSFHGLDDYGDTVAGLGRLSWLVPLGVDGLTLTAIAATFLLARAAYRVRLYAWTVFAIANTASVAGNLSHANARHLPWDGAAGAAAWPILLTLASHLAIVTRRSLARRISDADDQALSQPAVQVAAPADAASVSQDVAPAASDLPQADGAAVSQPAASDSGTAAAPVPPVVATPAAPTAAPKPRQRRTTPGGTPRDNARRRVAAGESCATVAMSLGKDKRTVERWTADVREARQNGAAQATKEAAG